MNDTSATLRAAAREASEAEATSPGLGTGEGRSSREMSAEKTARRRQLILSLILDAARGSSTYVKSYRAGRGAE